MVVVQSDAQFPDDHMLSATVDDVTTSTRLNREESDSGHITRLYTMGEAL